jgi:hypothetical protein
MHLGDSNKKAFYNFLAETEFRKIGPRTAKHPISMGVSSNSSRGPVVNVTPLSADVNVWLTLDKNDFVTRGQFLKTKS